MYAAKRINSKTVLAALCRATLLVSLITPDASANDSTSHPALRRALAPERSGCTAPQVSDRDPKLAACYSAQDYDVRNKRSYLHYVFCANGVRFCCQVDNRTGATSYCTRIDRTVQSQGAAGAPPRDPGSRRERTSAR